MQALALALPAKRFAAVHVLRVLKVMLRRVLKAPLARIGPTGFWTRCWADAASAPYAWNLMLQISAGNGSKVDSPRVCGERGAVLEITLWNRMYSGGEGLTSCGIGLKTFLMSETKSWRSRRPAGRPTPFNTHCLVHQDVRRDSLGCQAVANIPWKFQGI